MLKDCLSKFEASLLEFEKKVPMASKESDNLTDFTGEAIVDIFNNSGINSSNAGSVCLLIGQTLDTLSSISTSGGPQVKCGVFNICSIQ